MKKCEEQMHLKIEAKQIYMLSCAGFLLTAAFMYPYGIMRDNMLVFADKIALNKPPDNWMGWFYPYLWKGLYQLTGLPHVIGLVHNLLYWVSMPLLFIHWVKPAKFPILTYIIFAFCPSIIVMMMNITNNVLLLSFIAAALAVFTLPKFGGQKILGIFFLLCAAFIRRDALFIVIPLVTVFGLLSFKKKTLASLGTCALIALFFMIGKPIEKSIPEYRGAIDSISLINTFNLYGMSALKNELLIPDEVLTPFYQTNKALALAEIQKNPDIYDDEYFYHSFPLFKNEYWNSGLSLKKVLPLYLKNIFLLAEFRLGVLREFLFRTGDLSYTEFYDKDILDKMQKESFPSMPPFVSKIQYLRKSLGKASEILIPFFFQGWFYLLLALCSSGLLYRKRSLFTQEDFILCSGLIISAFIFWMTMVLAVVALHFRFLMPANFLAWICFIKILAKTAKLTSE